MIPIETQDVPADKLNNRSLFEAERQLLAIQNDPVKRKQSCVHEAGHESYCRKYGIKTTWAGPNIRYIPPDENNRGHFVPITAMVCPEQIHIPDIMKVGKILCAGYAAECALCNVPLRVVEKFVRATKFDTGSDFSQFVMFSDSKQFSERMASLFIQIVELVIEEMQDQKIREVILRIAEDFEKQIFTDPCSEAPQTGDFAPQS